LQTIIRRRDRSYFEQKVFTLDRKTSLVLTDGSFIRNPAMQSVAMILMALILGPLALVLLLACTNVTMLFLSRSITRRGEIAIRLALGAGRARLIRMLALESFFTAAAAGVASIYLAARFPFSSSQPSIRQRPRPHPPYGRTGRSLAILLLLYSLPLRLLPSRLCASHFDSIWSLR
jgi:ABC-type antimicrobial peptide transport system permease subunit